MIHSESGIHSTNLNSHDEVYMIFRKVMFDTGMFWWRKHYVGTIIVESRGYSKPPIYTILVDGFGHVVCLFSDEFVII